MPWSNEPFLDEFLPLKTKELEALGIEGRGEQVREWPVKYQRKNQSTRGKEGVLCYCFYAHYVRYIFLLN